MRTYSDPDFTISEAEIHEAITGIGNYIEEMYPNGCTVLGLLAGSLPTLAALAQRFSQHRKSHLYQFTTMGARSYIGEKQERDIAIYAVPSEHFFKKRNVIIVDDIIDSGRTVKGIGQLLMRKYRSNHVRVAALCVKGELPEWLDAAAVGFQLPKEVFVVGFGMDYNDKLRELQEIRPLRDEERAEKGTTETLEVPRTDTQEEAAVAAG